MMGLKRRRVEIVHGRDPDGPCGLTVYLDGVLLDPEAVHVADVDPGAGGSRRAYRELAQRYRSDEGLSPAFRADAADGFMEAADSSSFLDDEEGGDE